MNDRDSDDVRDARQTLKWAMDTPSYLIEEVRTGKRPSDPITSDLKYAVSPLKATAEEQTKVDALIENAFVYLAEHSSYSIEKETFEYIQNKPFAKDAWLKIAHSSDSYCAIQNHEWFEGKKFANEVWTALAQNEDSYMIIKPDLFMGKPHEKIVIMELAKSSPVSILTTTELFMGKPYEKEVMLTLAKAKPRSVLLLNDLFISKPYEKEVLLILAQEKDAILSFEYNQLYRDKPYARDVDMVIADHAPVNVLVGQLYLDKPYAAQMRAKAEAAVAREENALLTVQLFNESHNYPHATRFELLKYHNAAQDFNLITLGQQEAFSSTYQNILTDMQEKLHKTGKSLTELLSPQQMARMDLFLESAALGHRMDDVVTMLSPSTVKQVIHQLAEHAASSPDMRYINTMNAILLAPGCTRDVRNLLEQEIKTHYDQAKFASNTRVQDRFGLLAATYVTNISEDVANPCTSVYYGSFFLGISQNPRYQVPHLSVMEQAQLVDKHGTCNQRMIFSHDNDGQASFAHWKEQYQNKPGWKIEEHDNYTHIYTTGGKVPVHVYANHPGVEDAGLAAIDKEVAGRQKRTKPDYQVLVGRGHCYYTSDQIKHVTHENLIYLGACSGYRQVGEVLEKSPHAQVIGTQVTGSMMVNDPMLFSINQSINQRGEIRWNKQQEVLDHLASGNREAYVLPHKNSALKLQQRYDALKDMPPANPFPGLPSFMDAPAHYPIPAPASGRFGGKH